MEASGQLHAKNKDSPLPNERSATRWTPRDSLNVSGQGKICTPFVIPRYTPQPNHY